ncbi:MAG TPA: hypothetical protein VHN80_16620 [Kineosporiaceae bacterium]|nr:hypothetical protein [Kineosporiaceae bacterium]
MIVTAGVGSGLPLPGELGGDKFSRTFQAELVRIYCMNTQS